MLLLKKCIYLYITIKLVIYMLYNKMLALGEQICEVEQRADGRLWIKTYHDRLYVLNDDNYLMRADLRLVTDEYFKEIRQQQI